MSCPSCACLLVDDACLRRYTGLPVTVSYDSVAPSLRDAQDSSLEYLLGEECAEGLCSRFTSNSLTAADSALLAYVQPCLAWMAYALWLRASGTELGATGPQAPQGRTYNETTVAVTAAAIDSARRRAEEWRAKAVNLLSENSTDYPCYQLRCGEPKPPVIVVR